MLITALIDLLDVPFLSDIVICVFVLKVWISAFVNLPMEDLLREICLEVVTLLVLCFCFKVALRMKLTSIVCVVGFQLFARLSALNELF